MILFPFNVVREHHTLAKCVLDFFQTQTLECYECRLTSMMNSMHARLAILVGLREKKRVQSIFRGQDSSEKKPTYDNVAIEEDKRMKLKKNLDLLNE